MINYNTLICCNVPFSSTLQVRSKKHFRKLKSTFRTSAGLRLSSRMTSPGYNYRNPSWSKRMRRDLFLLRSKIRKKKLRMDRRAIQKTLYPKCHQNCSTRSTQNWWQYWTLQWPANVIHCTGNTFYTSHTVNEWINECVLGYKSVL